MIRYIPPILLALATSLSAQVPLIDGHRAKSYDAVLTSDSLQGRRSGLPGGEKAAAWIADQFRAFGLKPGVGDSSYFQNFTITTAVESGPMVMRLNDSLNFQYGTEFVAFNYSGAGKAAGPVVFVGYGIQEPGKGRDDLAGANLKGKIALALRGAPDDGEGYWGREGGHGYKAAHAADAGAVAYLQVGEGACMPRGMGERNRRDGVPCFWISRSACDRLLAASGLTVDSLFARANAERSGCHIDLPAVLQVESHAGIIPNAATRNVAAFIPGADPQLAREIVLIGGHMDHLGVNALGRIYPGADDNGSGASLVLELARTLAADPIPPRRSVYFCTFAGEELGLLGSEEFAAHPPVKLDSVVTMINMDMVGVGKGISIGGFPNFPRIWELWGSVLPDSLRRNLRHFKPGYYSDHAAFEDAGIPAFFIDTGGNHPHYHQPEDTVGAIQPELLSYVGDMVYRGMRAVADYPTTLMEPNRLTTYLWRSSEIALLQAPSLPPVSLDDAPDLVLYELGKNIDPSSHNRLRRLLVELAHADSTLAADSTNMRRVSTFAKIPSGQIVPAVALGLASPRLTEGAPEMYPLLAKLGVLFVHIPADQKRYFSSKGLGEPALELLAELQNAPQEIIWDVNTLSEARSLFAAASRPLIVRVTIDARQKSKEPMKLKTGQFLLLSNVAAKSLTPKEFQALGEMVGWYNLGVEGSDQETSLALIASWQKTEYSYSRIHDLLGLNLERYLRKQTNK